MTKNPTEKTVAKGTPRTRSPNYPAYDLQASIADAKKLLKGPIGRHAVGAEVAIKEAGYSLTSSTGKLRLASLRAFGLLVAAEGGKDRMVRLSPLALDIVADFPEGSPQQAEAVRKAALAPRMHSDLYTRYGIPLPPDDEIRRYLIRERGFNDKTVGEFIEEYKATISFAKLPESGTILSEKGDRSDAEKPLSPIGVGDYVQWSPKGVDQFKEPQRVLGFYDEDCQWAFVDGSPTGLPVQELTAVSPKMDTAQPAPVAPPAGKATPPANPFFNPDLPPEPGMAEEKKKLDEGSAVLRWPDKLSPESVEDFEYWMKGIIRRLRRKAGLPLELPNSQEERTAKQG